MSDARPPPRIPPGRLFLGIAVGLCIVAMTVTAAFSRKGDPSWVRIHEDFDVINSALQRYRTDHGTFPDDDDSLMSLVPEYLPAVPKDPWGRPYLYLNNGKKPLLVTFGHDGERGGDREEQDHNQFDGHSG